MTYEVELAYLGGSAEKQAEYEREVDDLFAAAQAEYEEECERTGVPAIPLRRDDAVFSWIDGTTVELYAPDSDEEDEPLYEYRAA